MCVYIYFFVWVLERAQGLGRDTDILGVETFFWYVGMGYSGAGF